MKFRNFIFKTGLCLLLLLSCCYSRAQEICNNGIDDDGDGKTDLLDDDCMTGVFNLIQNPSFESLLACPDGWSKLHYALNWMQPHLTAGSTDLYHKCGGCSYPTLGFIQQAPLPALHGNGFAGFYDTRQYDSYGEYKEYLATCVSAPIKQNKTYRLQFYLGFLTPSSNSSATTSQSPVDISFFGNTSCASVQYSNGFRKCPMSMTGGGWMEMKKITVTGNPGTWVKVEAEFLATADINGLVIGPSCTPTQHNGQNYYFIDKILLYEKKLYHLPQIDRKGDICADTMVLTGRIEPEPPVFTCQWYRNGMALPGENGIELKLTRSRYGEGDYSIRYTIGGIYYLSTQEEVKINDGKFYIQDSIALCQSKVQLSPELYPLHPSCSLTYLWQDGSTDPTYIASAPGWHWFETNKDGCRFRDSVFVFAYPAPLVNLGTDTILCPGAQMTLKAGDNNLTYLWQDSSTGNTYTVNQQGNYYVTASNKYCSTGDTLVVGYARSPEVRFMQDSFLCEHEEKILKPYLYGDEILWNTGSTSREITINTPGVYQVSAKNGCGEISKQITIIKSNCLFFLADVFTPNGDGLNDRFGLKEYGFIRQYAILIYNRWGEVVYQSTNPAGRWNGVYKGKTAPQGVYVWMVAYTDWLGRKISRKGTVILIR